MKKTLFILCFVIGSISDTFSQRFHGQKIVGYVYKESKPVDIDYSNLTHAMFAFLNLDSLGNVLQFEPHCVDNFERFLAQSHQKGVKRFISLNPALDKISKDESAIQNLATNLISFLKEYQMDGVDIDWEMLSTEDEKKRYTLLLKILSSALKKSKFEITATVGYGDYWNQWFDNEALHYADWIQIMVYDQTGAWASSSIGNHATFEHLVEAEKYWVNRGFSKAKIVLGVPFYGYIFPYLASSMQGEDYKKVRWIAYCDLVDQLPGLTDSANTYINQEAIFFNGPDLIKKKCRYIIDNHLAGVMIWDMTKDATGKKSLHRHIISEFIKP
jgi:GH18 family chitinase